jgi:hypothetical protein
MGQPQLNNTNSPNLNIGLGVAANDNLTSSPANENVIKQNTIGNQLAAQRAADFSANRRQLNNDDDTFNESLDDEPIPDGDLYQAPPKKKRSPQFFSGLRQQTANPAAQQQIAGALSSQRRAQMRTLAQQEQNLDSETEDLIKQLNNFRDSGSKKILSFFRPGLTTTIDRLVGHLKERTGSLAFRKQIAFLKGALITLQTLILTLQAFKFIACFFGCRVSFKNFCAPDDYQASPHHYRSYHHDSFVFYLRTIFIITLFYQ